MDNVDMTRILASASALLAAIWLTACSGSEPPADATPSFSLPAITIGPTPEPTGDWDDDDPYCDIVLEALELTRLASASQEATMAALLDPNAALAGNMAPINEGGFELLAYARDSRALYVEALDHVGDADAKLGIEILIDFVDMYSVPVGEIMAISASFEQLSDELTALTTSASVQGLIAQAQPQQQIVTAYTEERCLIDIP